MGSIEARLRSPEHYHFEDRERSGPARALALWFAAMRERSTGESGSASEEAHAETAESAPPSTPFDHPLFLPVLLFAGCVWFGYDGWFNDDPKILEHLTFNRYGFVVLVLLTLWTGYRGFKAYTTVNKSEKSPDST